MINKGKVYASIPEEKTKLIVYAHIDNIIKDDVEVSIFDHPEKTETLRNALRISKTNFTKWFDITKEIPHKVKGFWD